MPELRVPFQCFFSPVLIFCIDSSVGHWGNESSRIQYIIKCNNYWMLCHCQSCVGKIDIIYCLCLDKNILPYW